MSRINLANNGSYVASIVLLLTPRRVLRGNVAVILLPPTMRLYEFNPLFSS